ncbi:hypothetical protein [uncultured Algibacter sp.]|jgi:mono/diheme cytochrome c family protein|uniref:hypothetical protein n=1 Tax=uncultured Algibacter sp. TaxID=298659 RepID=UPI0026303442|nr:hypothetical protein [uncultured Algibacter sp.]
MKSTKLIYALALCLIIFNCSSDSNDDLQEEQEEQEEQQEEMDPNPTAITYNADIRSIMTNNCNQCHGSTTTNGAPFSLTTYSQVSGRIDRIIARTNNASNPMPRAGLMSIELRDMIKQWKDDGLLEE